MPGSQKVNIYFGGTFDPPHIGHHQMLMALLGLPEVGCVYVVPTSTNPLKQSHQSGLYTSQQRYLLCQAWIQSLRQSESLANRVVLIDHEVSATNASFTKDTLEVLKKSQPEKWVLVLSDDHLPTLDKWKGAPSIFREDFAELWLFSRLASEPDFSKVPLSLRQAEVLFRWLPNQIKSVSSTQLRQAIRSSNASHELDLLLFAPGVFEVLPNRS